MDCYDWLLRYEWWELEREDGLVLLASLDGPAWDAPVVCVHPITLRRDTRPLKPLKFPSEYLAEATAENLNKAARGDSLMAYLDPDHMRLCRRLAASVKVGDPECAIVKRTIGE